MSQQLSIKRMSLLDFQKGGLSDIKGTPGKVVVVGDGGLQKIYVYTNDKWLNITHDMDTTIPQMQNMHAMICTQCGAPLHGNKCEYCGTEYR